MTRTQLLTFSAALGGMFWVVAALFGLLGRPIVASLGFLLLLAVLVLAPLVLLLNEGVSPLGEVLQPVGAAAVIAALLLPTGTLAAALAVVWLLVTGIIGVGGLLRLLQRGPFPLSALTLDVALLYLPVGAVWLVFDRLAFAPLDFSPIIVTLTAAHFHYIPLAALTLTGMVGQNVTTGRVYNAATVSIIAAPLVVAAGISFSLFLEVVGALWLVAGMIAIAALTVAEALKRVCQPAARLLIGASALAVLGPMVLAALYPLGRWLGAWVLPIPFMIIWHGWVNALGFGMLGLLGWVIEERSVTPAMSPDAP